MPPESDKTVLSDAAKAEIAEAVRIVASDKSYQNTKAIRDHLIPPTPENQPDPKEGDPKAPPRKEETPEPEPDDTGGGIWWHKDRLKDA